MPVRKRSFFRLEQEFHRFVVSIISEAGARSCRQVPSQLLAIGVVGAGEQPKVDTYVTKGDRTVQAAPSPNLPDQIPCLGGGAGEV